MVLVVSTRAIIRTHAHAHTHTRATQLRRLLIRRSCKLVSLMSSSASEELRKSSNASTFN